MLPEPLVDDLAARAGPAPHQPISLERPANLVHRLPGRDIRVRSELIVIQGLRADPDRRGNTLAMAVR
jgi:hypothetical protein